MKNGSEPAFTYASIEEISPSVSLLKPIDLGRIEGEPTRTIAREIELASPAGAWNRTRLIQAAEEATTGRLRLVEKWIIGRRPASDPVSMMLGEAKITALPQRGGVAAVIDHYANRLMLQIAADGSLQATFPEYSWRLALHGNLTIVQALHDVAQTAVPLPEGTMVRPAAAYIAMGEEKALEAIANDFEERNAGFANRLLTGPQDPLIRTRPLSFQTGSLEGLTSRIADIVLAGSGLAEDFICYMVPGEFPPIPEEALTRLWFRTAGNGLIPRKLEPCWPDPERSGRQIVAALQENHGCGWTYVHMAHLEQNAMFLDSWRKRFTGIKIQASAPTAHVRLEAEARLESLDFGD